MATKTENIENNVNRFINELRKKYRVQAAYIYGSHSKGNAAVWSDRIEPHPFRVEDFDSSNPLASEIQKHGILIS